MALGAGRTELNIELTGEDDTRRMLEDAKRRMEQLEAQLRGLTGAARDSEDATEGQRGAFDRFNSSLGSMGEGLEGPVEGLDKLFGGIDKVMGVFGNLSEIVQGAIEVYKFFTEESEESKKATEALTATLKAQEEQAKSTFEAVKALRETEEAAVTESRDVALEIMQEKLKQAELLEQKEQARRISAEIEYKAELSRVDAIGERKRDLQEELVEAAKQETAARAKVTFSESQLLILQGEHFRERKKMLELEKALADEGERGGIARRMAIGVEGKFEEAKTKVRNLEREIRSLSNDILVPEKARADQAKKTADELRKQVTSLGSLWDLAKQTANALGAMLDRKIEKPEPTGGGGGGPTKAEKELAEIERQQAARDAINAADERAELVREAVREEGKLFDDLARKRYDVAASLDSIPKNLAGGAEKSFEPLAAGLKKQLAEIDKLLATRMKDFDYEIAGPEEEDALVKLLGTQKTAYDKLNESINQNIDAQSKAQEAAEKMIAAYERGIPASKLAEFQSGVAQMAQMSVPAFNEIGSVIGQVSEQLGKYKEGQITMSKAVSNSASSIAGAIAKQIGGVKAEAAIRGIFETAMGFATLANPVESAGHFTAAAMFGLVAGGVMKSGSSAVTGGQKAPASRVSSTSESQQQQGGGTITNVYNLQTGIVDGQSTARAFRQAEQQARNTGMASAGGW
jgi:hypothetical protein